MLTRTSLFAFALLGACAGALEGCAAMYGNTEVAMAEAHSSGAIDKGSITTLAIAPVALADREGNAGDVEGTTLEAYNTLSQAVDSRTTGEKFKVLTPVQFNAGIDARMTEKEKTEALVAAGKKAGASHVLIITSGKAEAAIGLAAVYGLKKAEAKVPVYVRLISVKTGGTTWQGDFDTTISFGGMVGLSETEARKEIVKQSISAFLNRYYSL